MPAFLAVLAILAGLTVLVWSADRFVEGAAATARHFRMPPLLIGMLVVGFGTSAPEMVVSVFAAIQGSPGIALGNAYGSNIANIGLILGVTALIRPIAVQPQVLRQELPFLALVTILTAWLLRDGMLSRFDAIMLLVVFGGLMTWSIRQSMNSSWTEDEMGLKPDPMSIRQAVFWLTAGLVLLVGSSRLLVWGAVEIARLLGISDLFIGLTVVALGTSLPELASSIMAARKGEDDIALGNILGSNLFNTLIVVGLAGAIHPLTIGPEVLLRDIPVMAAMTGSLFLFGYGFRGPGRLGQAKGSVLLASYVLYTLLLIWTAIRTAG